VITKATKEDCVKQNCTWFELVACVSISPIGFGPDKHEEKDLTE